MSVVTTPASSHAPSYGGGGGGSILTRPGWWRALIWSIISAVIAVAIPSLVRHRDRLAVVPVRGRLDLSDADRAARLHLRHRLLRLLGEVHRRLADSPEGHADHGAYSWRDYFKVNTDHKVIGIQYLVTTFVFFLIGGMLAEAFRAQLASPDNQYFTGDTYNGLISTHASIMIFLFIIPAFAGHRELRRAADARRRGHGLPAPQRAVVLDAADGRRDHGAEPALAAASAPAGRATRRSPRTTRPTRARSSTWACSSPARRRS